MARLLINELMSNKLGLDIRGEFPIFASTNGRSLSFLDSAASSQKPNVVIDRINEYFSREHANIHRGAYALSANATEKYEETRNKVARFLGASSEKGIVFTKNATEAINLVAFSYGETLTKGDSILLSVLEHHSNIVPWQLLAKRKGINLHFIAVNQDATLDLKDLKEKLQSIRPKLLAITAQSNAFGTLTPLETVLGLAKGVGCKVLLDGSQRIVHGPINVEKLDTDFLVFTGHKVYGPTGVGVLYAKPEILESMQPYQGGGDMIERVTIEGSTWAEIPRRFEAGTPAIAEVIALGTALDFVESIGWAAITAHEKLVFEQGYEILRKEEKVEVYGPGPSIGAQASIIPFNVKDVHSHDLATIADSFNVQIRSGHHCAMPALKALGLQSTARASIAMYSDVSDFEALAQAIRKARKLLT